MKKTLFLLFITFLLSSYVQSQQYPFYDKSGQEITFSANVQEFIGNVGIGSASPGGMLDVEGTLRPTIFNGLQNSNNNVGIGTFTTTKTLTIYGNIGIGTSASPGIQTGFSGSGATSCICKQFQAGLCTSATCT